VPIDTGATVVDGKIESDAPAHYTVCRCWAATWRSRCSPQPAAAAAVPEVELGRLLGTGGGTGIGGRWTFNNECMFVMRIANIGGGAGITVPLVLDSALVDSDIDSY
jgi:hypothetical protein